MPTSFFKKEFFKIADCYFKYSSEDHGYCARYEPTRLGVLALCAYYKQKDEIDFSYAPNCTERPS